MIAGFWARLLAFVVDGLVLMLVGMTFGLFCFDPLAHAGGWGRLIGFAVALVYFGWFNSSLGKGQTLGKRLLKIRVVDRTGACISPGRSCLRYAILGTPIFLNGAPLPAEVLASAPGYLISFLLFGLGGAIVYLYLFNRRTRQSLHDLATGTFVVRRDPREALMGISIWRPHWAILGVCFLSSLGLAAASAQIAKRGFFPELLATQKNIQASAHVRTATALVGRNWALVDGERRESSSFQTTVVWRERPKDYQAAAAEVAKIVLASYPQVSQKDLLIVTVTYGFDIGIARSWISRSFHGSPQEWERLVGHSP